MFDRMFSKLAGIVVLLVLIAGRPVAAIGQGEQRSYEFPEAAVETMIATLKKDDVNALLDIFGREYEEDIIGTDKIAARIARETIYQAASEMYTLREDGVDKRVLVIGPEAWPFPFPLVRTSSRWHFDTEAGIEEVINRRIGRNELNAINVCGAYVEAQRLYASSDRDDDGVLEYAQLLGSTPGNKDGLYWESETGSGEEISPFGPLVASARDYLEDRQTSDPFKGYYFRILTSQGPNPPGGHYSYVINGNMIAGFAMMAYPADWGQEGVMSFLCSHHGKTYEKDLGPDTLEKGRAMWTFNPDASWQEIKP